MTLNIGKLRCGLVVFLALAALTSQAWAQAGSQGSVTVTVTDASGGAVPGATLQLVDVATNSARQATTLAAGDYTFVNLLVGTYKLQVTRAGYQTGVVNSIAVHAALTTGVAVVLKVGSATQTVQVNGSAAALLDTTSNTIGTVVDLKQIEDLPLAGRNLAQLSRLTPGYSGTTGTGEWDGEPLISQGTNIDGTIGSSSRMKQFGNGSPAVAPRVEDISEMTVQTDQLDLDQGFGQALMQSNFVTRRGTNKIHGRAFDNFHNDGLNANTWSNNERHVRKAKSIYNDFGVSVGGPILKDRLFYFGSYAEQKVPGGGTTTDSFLTPAAQTGEFTYTGTDGTTRTVNVLDIAHNYSSTLPNTVNSVVASQLTKINNSLSSGTQTNDGADPNLGQVSWFNNNSTTTYFPAVRVDYNATDRVRMSLAWNMTYQLLPGSTAPPFPGSNFSDQRSGYKGKNYTSSYSLDWDISPRLINQFKIGFLYDVNSWGYNAKPLYASQPSVGWALGNSGETYPLPVTSYYPAFNLTDSVTFQKGKHTLKAGFTGYREQDHYWNPPQGFPFYSLGLAKGDPAINAFTTGPTGTLPDAGNDAYNEAQNLYATLTGRLSSVGGSDTYDQKTGKYSIPGQINAYNLDEVQLATGLFAQDSWRVTPSFTLNYGLRWDFTGQSIDKTGAYHNADITSVYGPTAPGDLFKPGVLNGNPTPMLTARPRAYAPFHVTPQPALGFAWNPRLSSGLLAQLAGGNKTVIRGGFSLRRFTEPYQYYWNNVSDQGSFFYQSFSLTANNTGTTGTFAPGSLALGDTPPPYLLSPAAYEVSEPESDFTFEGNCPGCNSGVVGIDPHIKQPYSESWNFGIERQFGSRVLEVRYVGNHSLHQWINNDTNEVNVFENGFLKEFQQAQANLAAYRQANPGCDASSSCSFADNGLAGQAPLPIMNAAFAGENSGGPGIPMVDYSNGQFLNDLRTGQVGDFAGTLAGINGAAPYFCNLVGSKFAPCVNNAGYTGGAGANLPINFFQANPFAAGYQTQFMNAGGYSNYNSLQIDLRQGRWHGLQSDVNYTWAHTLGFGVNTNGPGGVTCGGYDGWCAWPDTETLRNLRLAYGPAQYDIRHVIHFTGTYDLPFGKGQPWLSSNNIASRALGNWTVGTILTFSTGTPQELTSGNLTYNDYGDGGIELHGVTVSQLQKAIGVHRVPNHTYALLIDPKYLLNNGTGGANPEYLTPNNTPGTIGQIVYLHGPHAFYNDLSLSKTFPIFEAVQFRLQAEAQNAWNHPVFGSTSGSFGGSPTYGGGNIQNFGFGTSGTTNGPRVIEFRGNISF